jgi:hypothetical protein
LTSARAADGTRTGWVLAVVGAEVAPAGTSALEIDGLSYDPPPLNDAGPVVVAGAVVVGVLVAAVPAIAGGLRMVPAAVRA